MDQAKQKLKPTVCSKWLRISIKTISTVLYSSFPIRVLPGMMALTLIRTLPSNYQNSQETGRENKCSSLSTFLSLFSTTWRKITTQSFKWSMHVSLMRWGTPWIPSLPRIWKKRSSTNASPRWLEISSKRNWKETQGRKLKALTRNCSFKRIIG